MPAVDMQIIASMGQAIYGQWWQRHVARDLGVHACTIGRWLRGIGGPTVEDLHRLLIVARNRYQAILAAHEAGRQALRLIPPPPEPASPKKPPTPVFGPGGGGPPLPAWKARQQGSRDKGCAESPRTE